MLPLEEKVIKAALNFGKWRQRAFLSKDPKDRVQFVHSEARLGMAAQELYEERERQRDNKRRNQNKI